ALDGMVGSPARRGAPNPARVDAMRRMFLMMFMAVPPVRGVAPSGGERADRHGTPRKCAGRPGTHRKGKPFPRAPVVSASPLNSADDTANMEEVRRSACFLHTFRRCRAWACCQEVGAPACRIMTVERRTFRMQCAGRAISI